MKSLALNQADWYKVSHRKFMHEDTNMLYANFTPRSPKYAKFLDNDKKVVVFGLQHFIKDYLIEEWNETFFNLPKEVAIGRFKRRCDTSLGVNAIDMKHFEELHDLGYLPVEIKALPEGARVPFKVPVYTIKVEGKYSWLCTYLETVLSTECWGPLTSATTAFEYRKLCDKFADLTVGNRDHVMFQCHDFSFRGMFGRHAAAISGAAHLLSFNGTDTIPAIDLLEDYYNANAEAEFIAASVPASEHSVTSLGSSVDGEFETIKRWMTKDYPTGIVSIVSDTYDYFKVLTEYIPALKETIKSRPANEMGLSKVVIRPDSGDPVNIICGYKWEEVKLSESLGVKFILNGLELYDNNVEVAKVDGKYYKIEVEYDPYIIGAFEYSYLGEEISEAEVKGSIELLWEVFGGTISEKNYKVLDSHIGLIYGDSITLDRAKTIFERLQDKGFASSNVVFGVGSYTYQMVSRDTLGLALKATAATVSGVDKELFKDPKTDDGTKKSARGLLRVEFENGEYVLYDQQTPEQEQQGELQTVFKDGKLVKEYSLQEIRSRLLG